MRHCRIDFLGFELQSIQRQEATLAYEIIVVDNKPEQDAIAGLKLRFENVRSKPKPIQGGKLPVFFGGESGP